MNLSSIRPDFIINNTGNIKPEDLKRHNISAVGFDVDGTLTDYHGELDEPHKEMIRLLGESGIVACIISNAYGRRADKLADMFSNVGVPRNHILTPRDCLESGSVESPKQHRKPHPDMIQLALTRSGCQVDEFLMVGDQLLKDVLAGRRAGVRTMLVPRLGKRDHAGVKYLQRPLEWLLRPSLDLPLRHDDFPESLTALTHERNP